MRVTFVGVGNMSEAILGSVITTLGADAITVTSRRVERADELRHKYGVDSSTDNQKAVVGADVVIVGVKPHDVPSVLDDISQSIEPGTIVVSIAAGLTISDLSAHLPGGTAIVRVMPNTPALVGEGVSGISGGEHATTAQLDEIAQLFATTGKTVIVPEKLQNTIAAVSGSGPAYIYYVIDALAEAAVIGGLKRDLALEIATQTVLGAATLASRSGEHPALLREKVSSPGGTTVAALQTLDEYRVRAAFLAAVQANRKRSEELRDH